MTRDDLFIGVFPGGIMYADKSKTVRGDYENLALVNEKGISWYKKPAEIPFWVRESIAYTAKAERQKALELWNRLSESVKYERACNAIQDLRKWLLFTSLKGSIDEKLRMLREIDYSVLVEDCKGKRALTVRHFRKDYPSLKLLLEKEDVFLDYVNWQYGCGISYALVKTGGRAFCSFFCPDEAAPVPDISISSNELRGAILRAGCVTKTANGRCYLRVSDKMKEVRE